jgi:hypothetical protein
VAKYQQNWRQIFPPFTLALLIPVANQRQQIATGVNDTGVKQWEQLSNCLQL